jgi:hypothetical protein
VGRGALGDAVGTALAAGVALLIGGAEADAAASGASFGTPNAALVVSSAAASAVVVSTIEEVFTRSF